MADPNVLSDGSLREALFAQGDDLLLLSQAVLSSGLTECNALWKRMWWLFVLRCFRWGD
jgi:hypothetical protein